MTVAISTCSICHEPIYHVDDRWVHKTEGMHPPDHQATNQPLSTKKDDDR